MKIVYFGSSPFAVPALRAVAEHVVLVVTQPDQPSGRGLSFQPTAVKLAARELGLPVEDPEKSRDPEFVAQVKALAPDALLVASYGQILSTRMLAAAKRGGINIHASLLPKYRGAAPIQRAIEAGETHTGVTLMQMDKGMDTGDIIAFEPLAIGPDETSGELFDRLALAGASLAQGWMPQIAAGVYPRTPQNSEEATYAAKVMKDDALILPSMTAFQAYCRFRAFTPAPGAWLRTPRGVLRIRKCRIVWGLDLPAGEIATIRPELVVGMAEGALCLERVQLEGRKEVSGAEFANGARLGLNDSLFLRTGS